MTHAIVCRGLRMAGPGRLEEAAWELAPPAPGEAVIQVAGCGVCHTDLGYLYDGVPTRKPAPLVLGHEIAGRVVAAGEGAARWVGRRVVVPAVSPCGACASCTDGRPTSCAAGLMPGNDRDGGFATHATVPARTLCDVDAGGPAGSGPIGEAGLGLEELAVVADAVATPLQAIRRAGLRPGMLAVFVGVGGVGGFGVQLASALGAIPVAIDVDAGRLERMLAHGAVAALPAADGPKALKARLRELAKRHGAPAEGWRIFETSGSPRGQELAFALLGRAGVLSVVGFTPESVHVRLSNLMALDATAYGTWGADPAVYPEALALCASGKVAIRPFVRLFPLANAPRVLAELHAGRLRERPILVP